MPEQSQTVTVGTRELAERLGYEPNQREAICRALRRIGIRYFPGRRGPWTTAAELQKALDRASGAPLQAEGSLKVRLANG